MSFRTTLEATGIRGTAACLGFILLLGTIARADGPIANATTTLGNVDFDYADAPAANVELDLSQGMFHDLFGIGDAAVALIEAPRHRREIGVLESNRWRQG